MANLELGDQANAIWRALDDMLEKDPEGYKRYIEEQMKEAKSFKSKGQRSKEGEGSSEAPAGPSPLSRGLDMLLAQMGISPGKGGERLEGVKSGVVDKRTLTKPKGPEPLLNDLGGEGNGGGSLLDDNIGNSVIASIVTKEKLAEDEEEVVLDIKLPSDSSDSKRSGTGTPLIEEL